MERDQDRGERARKRRANLRRQRSAVTSEQLPLWQSGDAAGRSRNVLQPQRIADVPGAGAAGDDGEATRELRARAENDALAVRSGRRGERGQERDQNESSNGR